jgi:hypothetical protein
MAHMKNSRPATPLIARSSATTSFATYLCIHACDAVLSTRLHAFTTSCAFEASILPSIPPRILGGGQFNRVLTLPRMSLALYNKSFASPHKYAHCYGRPYVRERQSM